ncbi:MAG: hypothetical protein A2W91_03050 [Bacteroidetes bacterium GWF2_38_335]|nr:MAG: hypothetical protein A2W91_03050 [Bacteroidetes bacterium GWF2_38_335]OFY77532.1 MAG: hypothetical protein A2281_01710 [Bacteroidetes bacterium RIFOXYA12_FULL_38_20]HBS87171.1 hypothetical protein [Bacteroidales bacterium]
MKKVLLFALIIAALGAFSQVKSKKVDIKMGEDQKVSRKLMMDDIIGKDGKSIYALKIKYGGVFGSSYFLLEKYNNSMNLEKSAKMELVFEKNKMSFEYIVQFHDEFYVFSSYKNQKAEKNYLFVQSVNKSNLTLNNDLVKIAEIDYSSGSKRNSGSFGFDISPDSSHFMVFCNMPYEKTEDEKVGYFVFDGDMKKVWDKTIKIPHRDKLFSVHEYTVDNLGNVYLLGVLYKDIVKEKRHGEPNYTYQIVSITDKGSNITEYPVQLPDKFLTDMKFAINHDNDIICAGFYSQTGTFSIAGSYFLKIDPITKNIKSKSFKEFGIDFITQNLTERAEKKVKKKAAKGKNVELYEYDLDDLIIKPDGGAMLIGEQYYVRVVTTTSTDSRGNTTTRTTYYYYYNDIIVININSNGEIVWTEKIAKRQVTTNDGGFFSSYTKAIVGDKVYFVFNDNPLNLNYSGTGKVMPFTGGGGKKSLAVLVELSSDGKQKREALFNAKEAKIITRAKVCEQTGPKELILFGQYGKKQRFMKVTFK